MSTDLSPAVTDARRLVADKSRLLAAAGLVLGTAGNVSARVEDRVAITPTGLQLADTTAEQVCVVDLGGNQLAGELAPTSELDLHLGVYARYHAGAVVHTHAAMATALSCVLDELPCVHYSMLLLGGTVPVAPYRTFGSPELAAVTVDALDGHSAALMANHGAISFGHDLPAAVDAMELLEWACGVYWHAAQVGTPRELDAGARQAVVEAAIAKGYGSTRQAQS
jgi:L-fuculose-phosphate aldolase